MSRLAALALAGVVLGSPGDRDQARPSDACASGLTDGDADLYCIDLLPPATLDGPSGTARLVPPTSPYGISVSPGGEMQYDIVFTLRNLPGTDVARPPARFVAWATTPGIDPVVKLGEVKNGETRLGRVSFDRFLLIVTAERSVDDAAFAGPRGPTGRIVLRGTSAAMRMQPHDLAFLLAGLIDRGQPGATPAHGAHEHAPAASAGAWTPPPMHPNVAMPPAFMTLRPDVSPYLPADTSDAVPLARPRELIRLANGDALTLVAAPVRRVLFGRTVTMLGFNGQNPGPLIEVTEASTIVVRFTNLTDFETAVHWHGVRLDNRFDGAPHVTQDPVPPGGSFTGPYLTGPGGASTMAQVGTADEARRIVNYWADEGVTWFKAYTDISREALGAAIKAAHARGLKFTGHLCSVSFREAVALGIDNLEHGLFTNSDYVPDRKPDNCPGDMRNSLLKVDLNGPEVQQTIRDMVTHKVAMSSTLAVYELSFPDRPPLEDRVLDALAPETREEYLTTRKETSARAAQSTMPELFRRAQAFERAFVKAGGLLGAGVDPTGMGGALPGYGDHRNYELLIEAGFAPAEAIQIMTLNGARILGVDDRLGSIAAGKMADLVVIRGNPIATPGDIRHVTIVFKDGTGYDSPKLLSSVKGLVGIR